MRGIGNQESRGRERSAALVHAVAVAVLFVLLMAVVALMK